jgi:hypothetical protein
LTVIAGNYRRRDRSSPTAVKTSSDIACAADASSMRDMHRGSKVSDLVLAGSLRAIILGLIMTFAILAVVLSYQSLVQLVDGNLAVLAAKMGWAIGLGIAAAMLIRYRGELVDD